MFQIKHVDLFIACKFLLQLNGQEAILGWGGEWGGWNMGLKHPESPAQPARPTAGGSRAVYGGSHVLMCYAAKTLGSGNVGSAWLPRREGPGLCKVLSLRTTRWREGDECQWRFFTSAPPSPSAPPRLAPPLTPVAASLPPPQHLPLCSHVSRIQWWGKWRQRPWGPRWACGSRCLRPSW